MHVVHYLMTPFQQLVYADMDHSDFAYLRTLNIQNVLLDTQSIFIKNA